MSEGGFVQSSDEHSYGFPDDYVGDQPDDVESPSQRPVREYLTQEELDSLRVRCEWSDPVPVELVRRLLHDRDEWVGRAKQTGRGVES